MTTATKASSEASSETPPEAPPELGLPTVPLRRGVLFPGTQLTVPVGRARSLAAIEAAGQGGVVAVAVQRNPAVDDPARTDLHDVATQARILKIVDRGQDGQRVVLQGEGRVRLHDVHHTDPFLSVTVRSQPEPAGDDQTAILLQEMRTHITRVAGERGFDLPDGLLKTRDAGRFADRVATLLDLDTAKKVTVLETLDPTARLRRVIHLVKEVEATWDLRQKIGSEVRRELSREQKKALLRQQMRAIQRELGEADPDGEDGTLRKRLEEVELPEEVRTVVDRELGRLDQLSPQQPEHGVVRNYLELVADLPWNERAAASDDVSAVRERLERDHYGLDDVKTRILEHLAVAKLTGDPQGTILCLVGPPGVGKTSLAQSLADATGRPLVRVALGGVRDEAEIRGHRRTYVGALPGRIVSALRKVKVKNPVVVLDEVDKLGNGIWGSPEAALLELLDPEQNDKFTDHYLELPFDLSEVMFVATANTLETLSAPLRDRLEIIPISGYTQEEKLHIARRHLIPRRRDKLGLGEDAVQISESALRYIVDAYTRESGVRQLDRTLAKLFRAVALQVVSEADVAPTPTRIDREHVRGYLGKRRHRSEVAERVALAGVATGLAWTPTGGDILFIETSRMPGKGSIQITGQLGDVMQESARAALTYVRSHADGLGVDPDFLASQDIHVHVPAGGIPKDGPSAGVTLFTAFTSLLTGRRVRPDTAMTGEASLRGRVLPVGGIKEKVIAAHRAGLKRVILPRRNEADLEEVPESVREDLEVFLVEDMAEVLEQALERLEGALDGPSRGHEHGAGAAAAGT